MIMHIFVLLILFQVKHFLCDSILQNTYMAAGKHRKGWKFFFPLLSHVSVHAAVTALLVVGWAYYRGISFSESLPVMGAFVGGDLVIHFIMDRIKAGPKYWGKYQVASFRELSNLKNTTLMNRKQRRHAQAKIRQPGWKTKVSQTAALQEAEYTMYYNKLFWWCSGWDQMIHHLTHYGIIYGMVVYL